MMNKDFAIEIKNMGEPLEKNTGQNPLLPKHPFMLLIVGPSGLGKTTLTNLIIRELMDYFDALYICAKNIHEPKYQKLIEDYTEYEDIMNLKLKKKG